MSEHMIRIHVSDWNYQDKCYDATKEVVKEFEAKILAGEDVKDVWSWFTSQIDTGNPAIVNVERSYGIEDADFFFDYNNPVESVEEWEERW